MAAGINRVIYLKPYPKSYAQALFKDSICIDPNQQDADRIPFAQFIGICGPMFGRIFSKTRWKGDDGVVDAFIKKDASFVTRTPSPTYVHAEYLTLESLEATLRSADIKLKAET